MISLCSILVAALAVHAVVVPNEPGPGSVFNEGSTCHIAWTGDSESPTAWKDMTITLRTGSNFDMKTITEIASGQDGTVDGVYDYPCPDVTPQSAIYFYQFTAPGATADGPQWTTRFTIAAANGDTVPPSEAVQPDGAEIPWGIGALESGEASGIASDASTEPASSEIPSTVLPTSTPSTTPPTTPTRMTTSRELSTEAPSSANAAISTPSPSETNAAASTYGSRDAASTFVFAMFTATTMAFSLWL